MKKALYLAVALTISAGSPALAAKSESSPLTCEKFKTSLMASINENGRKVAYPTGYFEAYKREDGTLARYKWGGIVGLSGEIMCGKDDAFQDFSISVNSLKRISDSKAVIEHLEELAASALMAADGSSYKEAMSATVKTLKSAQGELAAARKRGESSPSGNDYTETKNGGQVEINVDPDTYFATISPPLPR